MRVLVTGGAGFIGFHVTSRLIGLGEETAVVDNFNDFYNPAIKRANVRDLEAQGPVKVFELDILDAPGLRKAFEAFRPHAVIHLAAWAGVRPSILNPARYTQVNVTGTAHLLEVSRQFGVENFLFGSSSSVYGGSSRVPFREDDPVDRPVSPYAATKRAGELLCHTYAHNYSLPVTCLRFFTVYGPRQRPEMAIHKFARLIAEGKDIPIFGDGSSRRDYTYVDDIVDGVMASLRLGARFEIFNLGESQTISLLELVSLLEAVLDRKASLVFHPPQAGDMEITFADIDHARSALGYRPSTPVHAGIRKFAEWFLREGVNG